MKYEITPEPDELERAAILAALEAEAAERPSGSPWSEALPGGGADDEPNP